MINIVHNPRCSKSRQALQLLHANGAEVNIIEYLKDNLTEENLSSILKKLKKSPSEIIRKGEAIYKENYKGKTLTEGEWLSILVENPKLIERPIVFNEEDAEIGRPPENVLRLL